MEQSANSVCARESAAPSGAVSDQGRKVYLWPHAFDCMRAIQKSQRGSPRFDLGDLTSAAVSLLAQDPRFALRVIEQARIDFVRRHAPECAR